MHLKKPPLFKVGLLILSIVVYVLIFFPLNSFFLKQVAILAVIPVITSGLLYGFRGGFIAGILVFPLNIILYIASSNDSFLTVLYTCSTGGRILGQIGEILIGCVVGRMHDLSETATQALLKFKESEIKLKEINSNLENIINARTEELIKANEALHEEITERKRVEQQTKDSRDFLDKIFKASADGIIIAVKNSIITMANAAMEKILGYSKEELVGKSLIEMAPPGDIYYERGLEMITRLFKEGSIDRVEQQYLHKDGHIVDIELSAALIKDSEGNMTGSVGVFRDITERKRAEEERINLLAAVEQAEETIIITDGEGTIQYINSVTWRKSGIPREAILGKNVFTMGAINDTKNLLQGIRETAFSGRIWKGRLQNRCQDGTFIDLETVITPVKNVSGNIINFICVSRDVTREIQLEHQLLQGQKIEAIGTLAGGIAHDFNNILAAIIGYTEIAQTRVLKDTDVKDSLAQVLKAAGRAKDLVKQILAFSRKSGQERKPLQLHLIIHEALKLLRASLPATIEILLDITQRNDTVNADMTQIHQIIMNLCTNAAHAMQEHGGVLKIGLAPVAFDEETVSSYVDLQPGSYIQLTVSDTGTGIAPDIIERIFDPFFTTKEVGKGTGMGLAVVHGIVKSHGGAIRVYSELGKGSTFHIVLPLIEEAAYEPGAVNKELPKGTERILFVDDEKTLIDVATAQLKTLGYTVIAKQNSLEALEAFQKDPLQFDLVITDLTMPQMTGDCLAQKLMEIRPDIPVILCTGYSEKVSEQKAKELGLQAFVMKPLNRSEIAETIRKVLDSK